MCGIAGIIGLEDKALLKKMLNCIKHRGPDDLGIYVGNNVSIGHVRLSIIDLTEAGRNPMFNEDESIFVVFNGEIYNFRTLRKELEMKGHNFRSKTDTEVIVHAYEEWGLNCLNKFNGMFAFALYDLNKKVLYLCRDQFGIKPLFYAFKSNYIFFSSELGSILENEYFTPKINKIGLYYCLSFLCSPAPYTLYEGINKLPPGHYIQIDYKQRIKIINYYDINDNKNLFLTDFHVITKKGEKLLKDSLDRMRYSDVPQGVLLSGGIDSSTIVALLSEMEEKPIETFSIGIANYGEQFNELYYANLVHEKYGTNHHEYLIEKEEIPKLLEEYLNLQYDFTGDPACILTYKLSKIVKQNKIKVVHVGEGADEIYCGYSCYNAFLKNFNGRYCYQLIPRIIRRYINSFLRKGVNSFKKITDNRFFFFQNILKYTNILSEDWLIPDRGILSFSESIKEILLRKEALPSKTSDEHIFNLLCSLNRHTKESNRKDSFFQDTRFLEFKIRLPELILMRVDNNTMLSSIEARVPYFDKPLVEFNMSLFPPSNLHCKDSVSKSILKNIMKNKLPKKIISRRKIGLSTPISYQGALNFSDLIETEFSRNYMSDFFNKDILLKIIQNKKFRKNFADIQLWTLLNFSFLYRKIILKEEICI